MSRTASFSFLLAASDGPFPRSASAGTSVGVSIAVGNPPPPVIVLRQEPRLMVVPGSTVCVVQEVLRLRPLPVWRCTGTRSTTGAGTAHAPTADRSSGSSSAWCRRRSVNVPRRTDYWRPHAHAHFQEAIERGSTMRRSRAWARAQALVHWSSTRPSRVMLPAGSQLVEVVAGPACVPSLGSHPSRATCGPGTVHSAAPPQLCDHLAPRHVIGDAKLGVAVRVQAESISTRPPQTAGFVRPGPARTRMTASPGSHLPPVRHAAR
jgi:hypothetical protein